MGNILTEVILTAKEELDQALNKANNVIPQLISDIDKKLEETKELVDGAGAASKQDVEEVKSSLEESKNEVSILNNTKLNKSEAESSYAKKIDLMGTNNNLESTNRRIDELIIPSGNANAEVTDAHTSTVKGKTFTTLRNRIEEGEKDFDEIKESVGFDCINKINKNKWTSKFENISILDSTIIATIKAQSYGDLTQTTNVVCETDKKIYVSAKVKSLNPDCTRISIKYYGTSGGAVAGVGTLLQVNPIQNTEYNLYGLLTLPSSFVGNFRIAIIQEYSSAEVALGKQMQVTDVMILDLNTIFGNDSITIADINTLLSNFNNNYIDRSITIADINTINQYQINKTSKELANTLKSDIGFSCKNYINNSNWSSSYENLTVNEDKIIATIKSHSYGGLTQTTNITCEENKKVFVSARVIINNPNCSKVSFKAYGTNGGAIAGVTTLLQTNPVEGKEYNLYGYIVMPSTFSGNLRIAIIQEYADASTALGKQMTVSKVMTIDVTETFGKYYEPKVEDFKYELSKVKNGYIKELENLYTTKSIYKNDNLNEYKTKPNAIPFIMPSKTSLQRPIMTISYDDESRNIYDYAFPVHKNNNVPGIFYVIPSRVGDGKPYEWGLSEDWNRLIEMDRYEGKGRIKIECHSYAHNYLPALSIEKLEENFSESIKLFRRNGIEVNHISYPGGYFNDSVQMITQEYFQSGRTTGIVDGINEYNLKPYTIGSYSFDNGNIQAWKNKIDESFTKKAWLNVFLHAVHPSGQVTANDGTVRTCMTPTGLDEVIKYAISKGVEIVTQEEALRTFAPIFYWIDNNANAPMVIQRNGVIANNVLGENPYLIPSN